MALGTITPVPNSTKGTTLPAVHGAMRFTVSTIVGDSAYSAGGSTVTPAQLGLTSLVFAYAAGLAGSGSNNAAVQATFNNSTGKLQFWATSGTSPVGLVEATGNLSGLTATVIAYGA